MKYNQGRILYILGIIVFSCSLIGCGQNGPEDVVIVTQEVEIIKEVTVEIPVTVEVPITSEPDVKEDEPTYTPIVPTATELPPTLTPNPKMTILLVDTGPNYDDYGKLGEYVLNSYGEEYIIAEKEEIGQSDFHISDYDVFYIPDSFKGDGRDVLIENKDEIQEFVYAGGVVIILRPNGCNGKYWTSKWSPYDIFFIQEDNDDWGDAIRTSNGNNHPILSEFKNDFLQQNPSCGFAGLDENWVVLASTENAEVPVLIEAKYGDGLFILSTFGASFDYNEEYNDTVILNNILDYALSN